MTHESNTTDDTRSMKKSFDVALRAELTLIDEEELASKRLVEAERKLASSTAKLAEIRAQVEKRMAAVERAENALLVARERRAAGLQSTLSLPDTQEADSGRPVRD